MTNNDKYLELINPCQTWTLAEDKSVFSLKPRMIKIFLSDSTFNETSNGKKNNITHNQRDTEDNRPYITVYAVGVPDDISPYINECTLPNTLKCNTAMRLYIYSGLNVDISNERIMKQIIHEVKSKCIFYPKPTMDTPIANIMQPIWMNKGSDGKKLSYLLPRCNFLLKDFRLPDDYCTFVECRHFRSRFNVATKIYNSDSRQLYNFVKVHGSGNRIVLLMPNNYYPVSEKSGYFLFDEKSIAASRQDGDESSSDKTPYRVELQSSLILHIISRYVMINARSFDFKMENVKLESELGEYRFKKRNSCVNDISIVKIENLYSQVLKIFCRLGYQRVYAESSEVLVATDSFSSVIFGDYSNINV